ncbi:hypothetical protein MBOE_50440 [Mycolicibacterium boenickei]|uniref:Uncharacterized protein n=1 Tax=Mycolicibacterium boenickei TaxID=146017 RepID=A0ABM7J2J6_9MYCO|nr:hypothetical protein MBOE_50440 [Mycolicibacterium boenickei]
MDGRISADDMVVGQDVGEAQLLDTLAVCAHSPRISAEFRLWKHHTYAHVTSNTTPQPIRTCHTPTSAKPLAPA